MKLRNSEILTLLMLVAPTALMLQSCCCHVRETVDEEQPIEQSSIMMGVASAGTKAIIDGSDANARLANMVGQCFTGTPATLKQNAGFGVYSYKSISDKSTILFDNTQVYPDPAQYNTDNPASTPWTYSPTRFWDMTASYQFIAYWPYLPDKSKVANEDTDPHVSIPTPANSNAVKESEKVLTIYNIPNWQPAAIGMDVMTSVRVGRYRSITDADGTDFSDQDKVGFMFKHALSQLVVKAYYINGSYEATVGDVHIKEITLERSGSTDDVPDWNGKTSFTQTCAATFATVGEITYAGSCTILDETEANAIPVVWKNEWVSDPDFTPSVIGSWLMVPHKWDGIKIKVSHKDGNGNNEQYHYSDQIETTLGKAEDYYVTQPGKTYIITLIINVANGGITVADIAVRNWLEPQKVIHEVYNW